LGLSCTLAAAPALFGPPSLLSQTLFPTICTPAGYRLPFCFTFASLCLHRTSFISSSYALCVVPAIASPPLPYLAAAPFVVHDYRIAHFFFPLRSCLHFLIVARYITSSLHNALLLRNTPTGWVGRIHGKRFGTSCWTLRPDFKYMVPVV
jgi:hypothetical protein